MPAEVSQTCSALLESALVEVQVAMVAIAIAAGMRSLLRIRPRYYSAAGPGRSPLDRIRSVFTVAERRMRTVDGSDTTV